MKEDCRDARGVSALESLAQDLRYGVRAMRRSPAFSITAVLTIALSTASIATVFTLGHTLLYRQLPADRPDELVAVSATRGGQRTDGLVSYPDYVAFRDRSKTIRDLAAHYPTAPLFVSANGNAAEINGAVVSANFLPMLGIKPALGRFFRDDEDRIPDRVRVAILSDRLWRTWFAASPGALGAPVRVNGVDFTVIGVAPSTFVGVTSAPVEIYLPTMMLRVGYRWCNDSLAADCTMLGMLGRLAPGRTLADAAAEFPTLMPEAWRHARKGENSGIAVKEPRGLSEDDDDPRLVRILTGVAVVLLLVCCSNLAGLLIAQSAARAGEFRIRLSLGAGPRRVIRQVITESLMLAVAGGVAGVVLSRGLIGLVAAMFYTMDDEGHPLLYDFGLTPMVVLTTMAAAVAAGCLFSIIPAIRIVRRPDSRAIDASSHDGALGPRHSVAWRAGGSSCRDGGSRRAVDRECPGDARRHELRALARGADPRSSEARQLLSPAGAALPASGRRAAERAARRHVGQHGRRRHDPRRRNGGGDSS